MSTHVFISHSRDNADVARRLFKILRARELDPWLDETYVKNGEEWRDEVRHAAEKADGFVFVIGPGRAFDAEQEFEWRSVLRSAWPTETAKALIPLLVGDVELPPFLRDRLALRMREATTSFDDLASRIVYLIHHPRETQDKDSYAKASIEQEHRLDDLKRIATDMKTAGVAANEDDEE